MRQGGKHEYRCKDVCLVLSGVSLAGLPVLFRACQLFEGSSLHRRDRCLFSEPDVPRVKDNQPITTVINVTTQPSIMTEVKSKWQKEYQGNLEPHYCIFHYSILQFIIVDVEARKQETFRTPTKCEKRDEENENNSFSLKESNVYY